MAFCRSCHSIVMLLTRDQLHGAQGALAQRLLVCAVRFAATGERATCSPALRASGRSAGTATSTWYVMVTINQRHDLQIPPRLCRIK
ncbi:hypothetical protein O3G_MSEX002575 [Manduca sexta]|uniref:Uncharacterized protein n=1 Tax=Manduca sexta TaxID=7130 RepID=A0A921YNV9_MANSE|nr:hypothetical protein O3G_MSEX002575 [Manduca sexta]